MGSLSPTMNLIRGIFMKARRTPSAYAQCPVTISQGWDSGQLVAAGSSQSSGNYSWILPSIDVHLRINGFARSKLTHHITFLLDVIFKEFIP